MWFCSLFDTLFVRSSHTRSRKRRLAPSFRRRSRSFGPLLEVLEGRNLLSAPVSTTDGLVDAIKTANSFGAATTITLASDTTFDFTSANNSTNGGNALPVITGNITIAGSGATIERTGSTAFRLFDVASGGSLTLEDLTLQGGEASGADAAAEGGAIYSSGTLNLSAVLVQGNKVVGANGARGGHGAGGVGGNGTGGGLYVAGGSASLINDTLSGNSAQGGTGGRGGVANIAGGNGIVGGPGGAGNGGGLGVVDAKSVSLINDTLSGNSAQGGAGGTGGSGSNGVGLDVPGGNGGAGGNGGNGTGGGLYLLTNSNVTLTNTLIAENNVATGTGGTGGTGGMGGFGATNGSAGASGSAGSVLAPDVNGSVNSSDHDLIGNPSGSSGFSTSHGDILTPSILGLAPLANNGGPTQTMALLPGSPAINAGDNIAQVVAGQFDQRGPGFARVVNNTIDIGAFEVQPPPTLTPPPPPSSGGSSSTPKPTTTLHTPPLLAFFDSLLGAVETVNGNETETVTDSIFGFPLIMSLYDRAGNLVSVTLFGINVTFLFESL